MTEKLKSLLIDQTYLDTSEVLNQETERLLVTADQLREAYDKIYIDFRPRELGRRVLYGSHTYDDSLIATRFYDKRGIEEIWSATDDFSHQYKNGVQRTITIKLLDDEGPYALLQVKPNDELRLCLREVSDDNIVWNPSSSEVTQEVAYNVLHRASDARSIQFDRTPEQRSSADKHAHQLLGEAYPDLLAKVRPIE